MGIRNRPAWIIPVGLAALAALYMSYVVIHTTACEDCKNYQSSPEEVRFIFTVYATLVFTAGLLLSAIGYGVGRLIRRFGG